MKVGISQWVQQTNPPSAFGRQSTYSTTHASPSPSAVRDGNVTISESARNTLADEMQKVAEARQNGELVDLRGRDGQLRLGLMALGQSTLDEWAAKGLEVTEQAVLAAAEALQEAFRKNLQENGTSTAGSSIALNRHQLVINAQSVPDWFVEEYEHVVSSIQDSAVKNAYKNGGTYYLFNPQ